jgi:predicted nucleic acid-binding protein
MSDIVVDSSVAAKWILPEVDSAAAQRLMAEAISKGERLIVLDLAFPEVANAIWKQFHRGLITLDEARLFLHALEQLPVDIEPAQRLLGPALEIAAKFQRSVYDSLFIALARNLGLAGVTVDEPLYKAVAGDHSQITLLRNWP